MKVSTRVLIYLLTFVILVTWFSVGVLLFDTGVLFVGWLITGVLFSLAFAYASGHA